MKDKGKKIRISESQLKYIIREMTISGDEELGSSNGDVKTAARKTIEGAKKQVGGLTNDAPLTVGFSDDALRKAGVTSEGYYTNKKQIKETRARKLMENSIGYTKKDLLKRMMK